MKSKILKRLLLIVTSIVVTLGIASIVEATTTNEANNMKVHYIDVGQSDSVLIESNKKFMLIDAGDIGTEDIIITYLKKVGVKKLDYFVLTHPHADHIGSARQVLENFQVDKLLMPEKGHTTKTFERLLETIEKQNKKITKPVVGDKYKLGDASFTIIAPNSYKYGDNLNNYSIGLKLTNGKNSFIFIGDAEQEAIVDILKNKISLKADVLMCGHHGSGTSTTTGLIKEIKPKYAVISVGENDYGHPKDWVLKTLDKNKIKVFRTDKEGTIIATSDGKNITFNKKGTVYNGSTTIDSSKTKVVYITKSGKKYHLNGCKSLSKSKVKIDLKKAKEKGYTACKICEPGK